MGMFRRNQDILWTFIGLLSMVLLIYLVRSSNRPKTVELDLLGQRGKSAEHDFVSKMLVSPGSSEEKARVAGAMSYLGSDVSAEQSTGTTESDHVSKSTWETKPAARLDETEASLEIRRTLSSVAALRSDEFVNSDSERNRSTLEQLRLMRPNAADTPE